MIVNIWNDDVVSVTFGLDATLIVNANYLQDTKVNLLRTSL